MKIIVCGAGEVGSQICRFLAREQVDLTVIDKDGHLVRRLVERFGISGVTGSATEPGVLEEAGGGVADLAIAATASDHVNIVVCLVAKHLRPQIHTMARLRNRDYRNVVERGFAHEGPVDEAIFPEIRVAESAIEILRSPSLLDRRKILARRADKRSDPSDGQFAYLLGLRLGSECSLVQTPLRQLSEIFGGLQAVVVGFRRSGKLGIALPDDHLLENDEVYVCVPQLHCERTIELFGKTREACKRVVIVGAGKVGTEIASQFEAIETSRHGKAMHVKLVDSSRERAERAAGQLTRTVVLHGDGMDRDVLEEAGIGSAEAILAVTEDDRTNLLAASRAKEYAASLAAVSLVSDPFLFPLAAPLRIDAMLDPRDSAISAVLKRSRGNGILGVGFIGDSEAEIIEVKIAEDSPLVGKTIRNANLPEGVMVGAVKRNGKVTTPDPDKRFNAGDKVAFFALSDDVQELLGQFGSDAPGL